MGGYGLFIWPCFAISAFVLTALYLRSRQRLKVIEQKLAVIEGRRQKGSRRNTSAQARESQT
ncbi:heme exporter protein CcmD [Sneathiella litorea]